ncbi:signal peptidase I [Microbacterium halophytorum]|uniref:signal peptidase I n=1 Tax=Microbacterium halophytorum TaxID=2067568 RepID=UPI000CFBA724|nr:signal peptidase I [Microbacterium halophytorum]
MSDTTPAGAPASRRERREQAGGADPREAEGGKKRGGALLFLRDVLVIVVIAVLVSFLIKTFVVRSFYIPSGSMENTLQIDDRILVDEITPVWNDYERGEIVVFADPGGWLQDAPKTEGTPVQEGIDWFLTLIGLSAGDSEDHLVKRLIGLPGDHVECCNALGQIMVNGKAVDESEYLKLPDGATRASGDAFDVTVPEGKIWVMGDNRYNSQDSRYNRDQPGNGFVPIDNVVGRVFFRTWPFERFGWMSAPDNFASVPEPAAQ